MAIYSVRTAETPRLADHSRSGAIRALMFPVSGLANATGSRTPSRTAPCPTSIAGIRKILYPDDIHRWPTSGIFAAQHRMRVG